MYIIKKENNKLPSFVILNWKLELWDLILILQKQKEDDNYLYRVNTILKMKQQQHDIKGKENSEKIPSPRWDLNPRNWLVLTIETRVAQW